MSSHRHRYLVAAASLLVLFLAVWTFGRLAGDSDSHAATPAAGSDSQLRFQPAPDPASIDALRLFTDEEYLDLFTRTYGPEVAVARLSEFQEVTGRDCHYPAHAAGGIAYDMLGPQAFSFVGHLCQSGAMHSVVEAVLRDEGTDNLGRDVEVWCRNAERAFFRHNCVHGIGHGLLVWVEYELPDALALCDQLSAEEDLYSCHGGVFMENVRDVLAETMAMGHEHPHRYLRPDEPHFPCSILEEKHLPACYFYQSSVFYESFGRDFALVARECGELPEGLQTWCFRSMGRDAGHHLRDEPAKVKEVCEFPVELGQRLDCLEEAVQHRFWETFGDEWVLDFCAMLEGSDEKVRCYWKIAQRASELYETPREYGQFCGRFEGDYQWLCDFALYQQLPEFSEQGRTDWIAATPGDFRSFSDRCLPSYGAEYCELAMYFQLLRLFEEGRPYGFR